MTDSAHGTAQLELLRAERVGSWLSPEPVSARVLQAARLASGLSFEAWERTATTELEGAALGMLINPLTSDDGDVFAACLPTGWVAYRDRLGARSDAEFALTQMPHNVELLWEMHARRALLNALPEQGPVPTAMVTAFIADAGWPIFDRMQAFVGVLHRQAAAQEIVRKRPDCLRRADAAMVAQRELLAVQLPAMHSEHIAQLLELARRRFAHLAPP